MAAAAAASTKVSFLASGTLIRSPLNKNAAESLSSLLSPPPLCWFSNTRGSLSLSLLVFPLRRYGFYLMPRLPYTPPHDQLRMLLRSGNQRMLRRCLSLSVNNLFLFNCETRLLKIIIIIKREKKKTINQYLKGVLSRDTNSKSIHEVDCLIFNLEWYVGWNRWLHRVCHPLR